MTSCSPSLWKTELKESKTIKQAKYPVYSVRFKFCAHVGVGVLGGEGERGWCLCLCVYMYEMENKNIGHNTANQGINLIFFSMFSVVSRNL